MIASSCSLEGTDGLHGVREERLEQMSELTFLFRIFGYWDIWNSLEIILMTTIVIANTEQFTEVYKIKWWQADVIYHGTNTAPNINSAHTY